MHGKNATNKKLQYKLKAKGATFVQFGRTTGSNLYYGKRGIKIKKLLKQETNTRKVSAMNSYFGYLRSIILIPLGGVKLNLESLMS